MKNKVKLIAASLVILASSSFAQSRTNEIKITALVTKNEQGKNIVAAIPFIKFPGKDIALTEPVTKGKTIVIVDPVLTGQQDQSRSKFAVFNHNNPMLGKLLMQNSSKLQHQAVNPKAFVKRQVIIRNHMQLMRGK